MLTTLLRTIVFSLQPTTSPALHITTSASPSNHNISEMGFQVLARKFYPKTTSLLLLTPSHLLLLLVFLLSLVLLPPSLCCYHCHCRCHCGCGCGCRCRCCCCCCCYFGDPVVIDVFVRTTGHKLHLAEEITALFHSIYFQECRKPSVRHDRQK
jgi:hypothetical protein